MKLSCSFHTRSIFLFTLLCLFWPRYDAPAQQRTTAGGRQLRMGTYAGSMGDATVEYDPETGSLIVITDEETNLNIEDVIKQLDKPIPQVLIKVLFLEVTYFSDYDLGLDAFYQDTITRSNGDVFPIELATAFGAAAQTQGSFARLINTDLQITIHALAERGKLEVLSRPSIMARHNQNAYFQIGQRVPIVANTRITDQGQTVNTLQYEDIGIILRVLPVIMASMEMVELDVYSEISTLTGQTVPISDTAQMPVIATRQAETRVIVPDGKTIVIGGLMEDQETETLRRVPILGDIPILGYLFRRTVTTKTKTELLIFLTPTIVRSVRDVSIVSNEERAASQLAPRAFRDGQIDRLMPFEGYLQPATEEAHDEEPEETPFFFQD